MIDNKRRVYLDAMILKKGITYSGDMNLYDFLDTFTVFGNNMEEKMYIIGFVCKNIKFMPNVTLDEKGRVISRLKKLTDEKGTLESIYGKLSNMVKSASTLIENGSDKLADLILDLPSIKVPDFDEVSSSDILRKGNKYKVNEVRCCDCEYFRTILTDSNPKYKYYLTCESCNRKYPAKDESEKDKCKPAYFGLISREEALDKDKRMYGVCPKLKK